MSKKLEAKAALIETPVSTRHAEQQGNQPTSVRTRTAVGGMAQFVANQSPIHQEAADLREKVKSFEGVGLVRDLDPTLIVPSEWANRHDDSFKTPEFAAFKIEIREAGGNIQPIKVRVLNGSTDVNGKGTKYEIVFGHRRHRACLEENLPVKALIEDVDDQRLFVQMERENRGRRNLSPWEQGCTYNLALQKNLYPSLRELARAINVDASVISKSITVAQLPSVIVEAFPSPLDIQFRWAKPLRESLQLDPDGVVARAKKIKMSHKDKNSSAAEVFSKLINLERKSVATTASNEIHNQGKRVGEISIDSEGGVLLKLNANAISRERFDAFKSAVEEFLRNQ